MDYKKFTGLLDQEESGKENIAEIQEYVNEFPYFQTAHALMARALFRQQHVRYDRQLKLASAYAGDRKALYNFIHNKEKGFLAVPSEEKINAESSFKENRSQSDENIIPVSIFTEEKTGKKESVKNIFAELPSSDISTLSEEKKEGEIKISEPVPFSVNKYYEEVEIPEEAEEQITADETAGKDPHEIIRKRLNEILGLEENQEPGTRNQDVRESQNDVVDDESQKSKVKSQNDEGDPVSQKSEVKSQKTLTQNQEPGIRDQDVDKETGNQNDELDDGSQKSKVKSQNDEVDPVSQKSEVKSQKTLTENQEPGIRDQDVDEETGNQNDELDDGSQKSKVKSQNDEVDPVSQKSEVKSQNDEGDVESQKLKVKSQIVLTENEKSETREVQPADIQDQIAEDASEADAVERGELEYALEGSILQSLEKLPLIKKEKEEKTGVSGSDPSGTHVVSESGHTSFTAWLKVKQVPGFGLYKEIHAYDKPAEEIKPSVEIISTHSSEKVEVNISASSKKASDLIDRFIESEPKIVPSKSEFYSPVSQAKKSVILSEDLVSETLAKIYAQQGDYEKALSAYRKLTLLYPEKKAYFAALILQIDRDINNPDKEDL